MPSLTNRPRDILRPPAVATNGINADNNPTSSEENDGN